MKRVEGGRCCLGLWGHPSDDICLQLFYLLLHMTNKVGNLTTLADSRSPEDGQLNLGERRLLPLDLADSADTAGAAHLSCHQSHS